MPLRAFLLPAGRAAAKTGAAPEAALPLLPEVFGKGGIWMSFQVAVYGAESLERAACQTLCSEYFAARPGGCQISAFACGAELLEAVRQGGRFDLFLLDVQPARPNGIDLAQALRALGTCSPLVFLASTRDYAYDAFQVNALQYLLKPVGRAPLFEALDRAVEPQTGPMLPVSTPFGLRGISFHDIVYVECTDHLLHFHRLDGTVLRSVSLRVPFAAAAAPLLCEPRFLQPHRSYVVNLDHVVQLSRAGFEMENGATVPVPREKYPAIHQKYRTYLQNRGLKK